MAAPCGSPPSPFPPPVPAVLEEVVVAPPVLAVPPPVEELPPVKVPVVWAPVPVGPGRVTLVPVHAPRGRSGATSSRGRRARRVRMAPAPYHGRPASPILGARRW